MAQGTNARTKGRRTGSDDLATVRDTPTERLDATPLTIAGRTVWAGKLGLNQLVAAARLLVAAAAKMTTEERATLVQLSGDAAKGGAEEVTAGLASLLMAFDEDVVRRAFGIVLDVEAEWCGKHLGAADVMRVIEGVVEHNEIDEVKAAFFRLVRRFQTSPATT